MRAFEDVAEVFTAEPTCDRLSHCSERQRQGIIWQDGYSEPLPAFATNERPECFAWAKLPCHHDFISVRGQGLTGEGVQSRPLHHNVHDNVNKCLCRRSEQVLWSLP